MVQTTIIQENKSMGLKEYIEKLKYEKKYWEQRSLELKEVGGMVAQCARMIIEKDILIAWLEELQSYREGNM